jgi:negative regulator of sigma-B (phosphoserine phosphatase)
VNIVAEHLSVPCEGYDVNGDAVLVRAIEGGFLVAVIDALGHGPTAAAIANQGIAHLVQAHIPGGVLAVMHGLHDALHGTRGAAAMVLVMRGGAVEGCGVGNVDLRTLGGAVPARLSPGIIGVRVRRFNVFAGSVTPGSRILIFSDGISAQVPIAETAGMAPAEACSFIQRGYRRAHDDSTILVIDVKD